MRYWLYKSLASFFNSSEVQALMPGGSSSYLVYTALITQASNNPPNATVLQNTLGGTVVWSYSGVGEYYCTLSGAFPEGKTAISITPGSNTFATVITSFNWDMPNAIGILSFQEIAGALSKQDGIMGDLTLIEIRVYP